MATAELQQPNARRSVPERLPTTDVLLGARRTQAQSSALPVRKAVRWLHRWFGLSLALLLMFSALTGSVIAFEHELDEWLNPALFSSQQSGTALDADQLTARIEASDPRLRVSLLLLDNAPGRLVQAQVAARPGAGTAADALGYNRVFVDPVSGQILGRRMWGAWTLDRAHALPLIDRLHRSLTLPGRWGNWVVGGVAIGWLALSLMGFYLSLPRIGKRNGSAVRPAPTHAGSFAKLQHFWQRWKPAWRIKRGATGIRFVHDLHRAVGLWTLPLGIAFAFTGVYLNLANEVFRPLVGLVATITPQPLRELQKQPLDNGTPALSAVDAIAHARAFLPAAAAEFQSWFLSHVPDKGVYRIAFKEPGLREQALRVRSEQVFIDDRTGALRGMSGYDSGYPADRFLAWQYPVHTGKALGWTGRVLVAIGGLLVALLCAAGIWQWGLGKRGSSSRRVIY